MVIFRTELTHTRDILITSRSYHLSGFQQSIEYAFPMYYIKLLKDKCWLSNYDDTMLNFQDQFEDLV